MTSVAFAAIVTAAVEPPIVAAFYPARRLRAFVLAIVVTLATNLWMNVVLPHWVATPLAFLVVGEGVAFVVEALVYALASRPIDLPRAIAASAFANGASFGLGLLLPR